MGLTFAHDFVTSDLCVSQSPPPIEWFERFLEDDELKIDSVLSMMLNEINTHVPEEVYDFWVEGWNINQGCSLTVTVHIPLEFEWTDVNKYIDTKKKKKNPSLAYPQASYGQSICVIVNRIKSWVINKWSIQGIFIAVCW